MQAIKKNRLPFSTFLDVVMDSHSANFWLQKVNPVWSVNQALGIVVDKEIIARDVVALTIECNRHFQMGKAGQHHPVFITINGICYERTYSLTQVSNNRVLLVAKKVDKGVVSSWLLDHSKVGDVLEFGLPYGDMILPQFAQKLILLAAGSGITPMHGLIQELIKSGEIRTTPITLMYWVKNTEDVAFKQVFEKLAEQYETFEIQFFYTQDAEQISKRLNEEHLALLNSIDKSIVYACGPSGFTSTVESLFTDAFELKTEAFSMTPVIYDDVGFVNVTLTRSNKVVVIPKGQPILLGLEQQDIKPQHGCRMGICNKCSCKKTEGTTRNLVNGMTNPEPGNLLRICVNSAQTDLVIDL